MPSLSNLLPEKSPTVQAIYDHYKQVGDAEPTRGYLGASIIGHPCERYLWYVFRLCCKPSFDGRMYRLFETGEKEEFRLCKDLCDIGCTVHEFDENGEQFAIGAFGGHFSGHLDGCALGIPGAEKTWHVLEFKTHNAKSFGKLQKDGVKKAKPQHYAQMTIYMHLTGMTRALYLAVNKDTDDLYAERVRYNKGDAQALMDRALRVITASEPPPRLSDRPDYYECKWCDAHDICHGCDKVLPLPVISCKQCCYATPIIEGNEAYWRCEQDKALPNPNMQPCDNHLCLPGLFPYAEVADFTDGMICFKNRDNGKEWQHGGFCHSTKELMGMTREEL